MDTKLTLKLDEGIIEKAKTYARSRKTSLSALIQNYLETITHESKGKKKKITPLVKSLSGIISLPQDDDHQKEYTDYLTNKYK